MGWRYVTYSDADSSQITLIFRVVSIPLPDVDLIHGNDVLAVRASSQRLVVVLVLWLEELSSVVSGHG